MYFTTLAVQSLLDTQSWPWQSQIVVYLLFATCPTLFRPWAQIFSWFNMWVRERSLWLAVQAKRLMFFFFTSSGFTNVFIPQTKYNVLIMPLTIVTLYHTYLPLKVTILWSPLWWKWMTIRGKAFLYIRRSMSELFNFKWYMDHRLFQLKQV